jgi:hypothetical protein
MEILMTDKKRATAPPVVEDVPLDDVPLNDVTIAQLIASEAAVEAARESEKTNLAVIQSLASTGNTTGREAHARVTGPLPAVHDATGSADSEIKWSKPDTPQGWAKRFDVSDKTFKRYCSDGKIRHKKLSDRSYQVDTRDIPDE